jgi:hypothetical protein
MRHRLLISARSLLFGWATLLVVTNLVEHPLLYWAEPLLGASWFPTAQLALECAGLVATGWIIGRWNQRDGIPVAIIFSVMLAVWDFGLAPSINLRWLARLTVDAFEDARYLESWITAAVTHALLFGSLFAGVRWSHPRRFVPVSIVEEPEPDKPEPDNMDDDA